MIQQINNLYLEQKSRLKKTMNREARRMSVIKLNFKLQ